MFYVFEAGLQQNESVALNIKLCFHITYTSQSSAKFAVYCSEKCCSWNQVAFHYMEPHIETENN